MAIPSDLKKLGYSQDFATGFIDKKDNLDGFKPIHKTKFLKALKIHGNQSKAAHDLGFSYKIVEWHLRKDLKFNEAFQETLLEMKHALEGRLYEQGIKTGGVKQAQMWLVAHFPEDYVVKNRKPQPKSNVNEIEALYEGLNK